jgi:hypothetical protein
MKGQPRGVAKIMSKHSSPTSEPEIVSAPRQPWTRPELTILPIAPNTHHAANTVSDGTGNLYS